MPISRALALDVEVRQLSGRGANHFSLQAAVQEVIDFGKGFVTARFRMQSTDVRLSTLRMVEDLENLWL